MGSAMNFETEQIREIDISRQARALRFLRFTDYLLVIVGGTWLIGMLGTLVVDPKMGIFDLVLVPVLFWGAYTGWRNVGVIDACVWRSHMLAFPLIISVSMVVGAISLFQIFTKEGRVNTGDFEILAVLWTMFLLTAGGILGFVSVLLLRRMRIKSLGVRLVELLRNLANHRDSQAIQATRINRVNVPRGILFAVSGGIILLSVILIPLPADPSKASKFLNAMEQLKLLAFFFLLTARRYFQVSADSLLAVDKRNPILFLRSFDDDEKVKFSASEKAILDFSLETRLSNHFTYFGPFIAIGSPKQPLPVPGAARVLLADSEWQPRVMGWMSRASLIIMYSGKTHWVNWELAKVLETDRVQNLILMIPERHRWWLSSASDEFDRIEHVRDVFKNTKWSSALAEILDFQNVRAMLFHGDGSMTVIKSHPRNRDSYHLAALVAHYIILNEANEIGPKVTETLPLEIELVEKASPSTEVAYQPPARSTIFRILSALFITAIYFNVLLYWGFLVKIKFPFYIFLLNRPIIGFIGIALAWTAYRENDKFWLGIGLSAPGIILFYTLLNATILGFLVSTAGKFPIIYSIYTGILTFLFIYKMTEKPVQPTLNAEAKYMVTTKTPFSHIVSVLFIIGTYIALVPFWGDFYVFYMSGPVIGLIGIVTAWFAHRDNDKFWLAIGLSAPSIILFYYLLYNALMLGFFLRLIRAPIPRVEDLFRIIYSIYAGILTFLILYKMITYLKKAR